MKKKIILPLLTALVLMATLVVSQFALFGAAVNLSSAALTDAQGKPVTTCELGKTYTLSLTSSNTSTAPSIVDGCGFSGNAPTNSSGTVTITNFSWNGNGSTLILLFGNDLGNIGIPTTNPPAITEEVTTVVTVPPAGTPVIAVYNDQTPLVKPGKSVSVNILMINEGADMATYVEPKLIDEKGLVKVVKQPKPAAYASYGNSFPMDFVLDIPELTPSGKYPLTLKLKITNKDNVKSEQSVPLNLNVSSSLKAEALNIVDYSIDKAVVSSGDNFTLSIRVENDCGIDLNNAKVMLEGLDGTKFGMATGLTSQSVKLKKGASTVLKFPLVGCKGISSIREVIPVKITYQLDDANKDTAHEVTTNITIPCKVNAATDPDTKSFAPNIIIDSYSFGGDYVLGGKTFPLEFSLRNSSTTATIQNLKVTVQGGAGSGDKGVAFSPANSSNSFFFPTIASGASQKISLDILPKSDAKPDSYPIQVIFNYEYTNNGKTDKAETVTETLSIPLQQEDRLVANAPELQTEAYVGQDFSVNATFVNKGKSAVYNVSVDVEGEGFDKTSSAYYIGNIESGKEEFFDTTIRPNVAGELKGNIVVTYEDSNGQQKEIKQEFMTTVMDANMGGTMDGGMMGGDMGMIGGDMGGMPTDGKPQGKMPVWGIIAICVGGAAVVVVGIIVTVKIIKKKKAKAAEIEDDDENN